MINYLLKIWVLLVFSAIIIFYYYSNWAHIENFDWYLLYILPIALFYWIYKYTSLCWHQEKVRFTPFIIGNFFLIQLLLLSILFFSYTGYSFWDALWSGLTLFIKIFFYSLLPLIITIISLAFWQKSLWMMLDDYSHKSPNYRFLTGIWFWFFIFVFALTIVGMLWAYNLGAVFLILLVFIIFSYKELISIFISLVTYKIEYKNHDLHSEKTLDNIQPRLLIAEFFFIVITLILAINLISIFRPFPIGWDDLWAYMNFPRLMANSWYIGELGSMMGWQTFTGIGYMFSNPTLAFFLNNVWWFLSVISVILIVSEIFKNKKNSFIDLPLLAAMIFISMPMIVFQQAKDMKLDPGLFFISIIALYMLFDFYIQYRSKKEQKKLLSKWWTLKLFFVIWLLLGFAFTIKFTSLLLISALFAVLFYARLWVVWFLWFISIYFAIFTAGGLWKMMNVIALDSPELKQNFSLAAWIIWIMLLVAARLKTKKRFRRFIPRILSLSTWIIIAIAPWWISNIISTLDSNQKISVSKLISGSADRFELDYTKIYSKNELENIKSAVWLRGLSASGTTSNEDFWRYFGYEKGINNYVKLPWNLTMQTNQWWEFTTIGFLFLALLPTIFLFLPFWRKEYSIWIYLLIIFEILLFIVPQTRDWATSMMSGVLLPYWYIFILLLGLLPLVFFIPTLQKADLTKLFKINLMFAVFYTFLWWISAFWIVWYGIVMYFNFILMIVFWAYYISSYREDDTQEYKQSHFFWSIMFLSIIGVYLFFSVFPHTFNNLKSAGYINYKLWKLTVAEAPFFFHREYLPILFTLNIDDVHIEKFINNSINWDQIKSIIKDNNLEKNITGIQQLLIQIISDEKIDFSLRTQAQLSLQKMYKNISEPNKQYKNTSWIYRIGTFLKYHISENNKRLVEDSLISIFDTYMYDEDPNITIWRMQKLGIKYLLVDLNAATIDKDPRRALTQRYENLISSFTSDKLELVDTDSICLKLGLSNYKKDWDKESYIHLAWVNYDWYSSDWKTVRRTDKLMSCYNSIISLVNSWSVTATNYDFLYPYVKYISELQTTEEKINFLHKHLWHGYKVLFTIK